MRYENLKMEEDERISSFMIRVNEITMGIKCSNGNINEDEVVSKILRGLHLAYKMRVNAIERLWTMSHTPITREKLLGKLTAFELSEFGDQIATRIETSFKASISWKKKHDFDWRKKNWKEEYVKELEDMEKEEKEMEELEAPISRRILEGSVVSMKESYHLNSLHAIRLVTLTLDFSRDLLLEKLNLKENTSLVINIDLSLNI